LEKLLFQVDDKLFCIEIDYVVLVEQYEKVKDQLDDIKVIDFRTLYNQQNSRAGEDIIFIGKDGRVLGLIVDKILKLIKNDEISTYKNENFMLEYIKGVVKISNYEDSYLIDAKKILEVAYEK